MSRRLPLISCSVLAAGLAAVLPVRSAPQAGLQLLGQTSLPYAYRVDGVPFGGISGLERDPRSGHWYLLSDDKSAKGPARFYIADIPLGPDSLGPVQVLQTVTLLTAAGLPFPPHRRGESPAEAAESADAESLRLDPAAGELWWASEGDPVAVVGPSVRRMDLAGRPRGSLPLPGLFALDPERQHGPRPNLSFEGISWDSGGENLWIATEGPLYQDGPMASEAAGALVRLSLLARDGRLLRQHAYRVDRVPAHDARMNADNGISEILALDADHLLVLERAGLQQVGNHYTFRTRLYCANLAAAGDTSALPALANHRLRIAGKTLLFDLGRAADIPRSNFEALARGPALDDGRATFVLASDNNFDEDHNSDFVLLATPRALDADWLRQYCR
jgi:hypothetical protein